MSKQPYVTSKRICSIFLYIFLPIFLISVTFISVFFIQDAVGKRANIFGLSRVRIENKSTANENLLDGASYFIKIEKNYAVNDIVVFYKVIDSDNPAPDVGKNLGNAVLSEDDLHFSTVRKVDLDSNGTRWYEVVTAGGASEVVRQDFLVGKFLNAPRFFVNFSTFFASNLGLLVFVLLPAVMVLIAVCIKYAYAVLDKIYAGKILGGENLLDDEYCIYRKVTDLLTNNQKINIYEKAPDNLKESYFSFLFRKLCIKIERANPLSAKELEIVSLRESYLRKIKKQQGIKVTETIAPRVDGKTILHTKNYEDMILAKPIKKPNEHNVTVAFRNFRNESENWLDNDVFDINPTAVDTKDELDNEVMFNKKTIIPEPKDERRTFERMVDYQQVKIIHYDDIPMNNISEPVRRTAPDVIPSNIDVKKRPPEISEEINWFVEKEDKVFQNSLDDAKTAEQTQSFLGHVTGNLSLKNSMNPISLGSDYDSFSAYSDEQKRLLDKVKREKKKNSSLFGAYVGDDTSTIEWSERGKKENKRTKPVVAKVENTIAVVEVKKVEKTVDKQSKVKQPKVVEQPKSDKQPNVKQAKVVGQPKTNKQPKVVEEPKAVEFKKVEKAQPAKKESMVKPANKAEKSVPNSAVASSLSKAKAGEKNSKNNDKKNKKEPK